MSLNKKKINFVNLLLLLMPIIDILNTITNTRISLIVRSVFLLLLVIYLLFFYKDKNKKGLLTLLSAVCIFLFFYLIHNFFVNGLNGIVNEIITIIKFIYLPIITICLYACYKEEKESFSEMIVKIAYLYSFLILIPTVLGFGLKSYESYKLGYSGLFYSPNEISNILAILSPFVIFNLIKNKKSILTYILTTMFIVSCFILGTKTPFIGLCLTLFIVFVILTIRLFFKNKKDNILSVFIIVIITIFTIVCYNNSYLKTNLNLQDTNYGEVTPETNIENIPEQNEVVNESDKVIVQNPLPILEYNVENVNFPTVGHKEEIHDNKMLNMIFSSRNIYLQRNLNKMKNASVSHKLLGITTGNSTNLSELDMGDIFIYYGILGVVVFVIYLFYFFIKFGLKIIFNLKTNIMDNDVLSAFISFSISLLVALTAGHTMNAPAVSLFIALNIVLLVKKLKLKFNILKNKKINIVMISIFVLLIMISILNFNKSRFNLNIELKNDNIVLNKDMVKVEERIFEYDGVKEKMLYYTSNTYKNFRVIYVIREFDKNNKIYYLTLNNNEAINIDVNIDSDNLVSDNMYIYTTNNTDIKPFYNDIARNLKYTGKTKERITLKQNESMDTFYTTNKLNNNDSWITYKGIFKNVKNNLYVRDLSNKDNNYTNEILIKNALFYLNEYSSNLNGIIYKDYIVKGTTNIDYNNIYLDFTLNYNIYKMLSKYNVENTIIQTFMKNIKEEYDKKNYVVTNNGILFNKLIMPTLKENIAITNVLIESYKNKKDNKIFKIITKLLDEITSNVWDNDTNLYEYITNDLEYKGKVEDIEVFENYIYLYDNLNDIKLSKKYNMDSKIEKLINKFGTDNLNNELKSILKAGDFIE